RDVSSDWRASRARRDPARPSPFYCPIPRATDTNGGALGHRPPPGPRRRWARQTDATRHVAALAPPRIVAPAVGSLLERGRGARVVTILRMTEQGRGERSGSFRRDRRGGLIGAAG